MSNWQPLSPSQYHRLEFGVAFGVTDVGTVRESNQDNFLIAPELGLVAVADGMGGHAAGEIASAEALRQLADFIGHAPAGRFGADPDATWTGTATKAMVTLRDAVAFANERLYQANVADGQPDGTGMGTTLTGFWQATPGGPLLVFHVGDSRLYCWRDGALAQLTRDQTLYQQAVDMGVQDHLPARNLLLQAMGPTAVVQPELLTCTPAAGDLYLLCSDGLYGNSAPEQIAAILSSAQADNLHACCEALVEMAKRDGSRDNITVVLASCR